MDRIRPEDWDNWGPEEWLEYSLREVKVSQQERKAESDAAIKGGWKRTNLSFKLTLGALVGFTGLAIYWHPTKEASLELILIAITGYLVVNAIRILEGSLLELAERVDSQRRLLDELQLSIVRLSHRVRPFKGPTA